MEIANSKITATTFCHDVFVTTAKGTLKYEVEVRLSGANQSIEVYKRHYINLTTSEKKSIKKFIVEQFLIK